MERCGVSFLGCLDFSRCNSLYCMYKRCLGSPLAKEDSIQVLALRSAHTLYVHNLQSLCRLSQQALYKITCVPS